MQALIRKVLGRRAAKNKLIDSFINQWAWLMMKIVSWNVNGLKAVVKNRQTSLKGFLDHFDADIVCIQETKATSKLVRLQVVQYYK